MEPVEFLDAEPVEGTPEEVAPPVPGTRWRWLVVGGALVAVVAGAVVAREAADAPPATVRRSAPPSLVAVGGTPVVRHEVPFPEQSITVPEPVCRQTACLRTGFVPTDLVEAVFEVFPHVELGERYSVLNSDRQLVARHVVGKVGGARLVIDVSPVVHRQQPSGRAAAGFHVAKAVVFSGPYRIEVRVANDRIAPSRLLRLALDERLVATV